MVGDKASPLEGLALLKEMTAKEVDEGPGVGVGGREGKWGTMSHKEMEAGRQRDGGQLK